MLSSLQNLTFLIWILLLGVLTSLTNANYNETWFPTDQNVTMVGNGWSAGWEGRVPSDCSMYPMATRFTFSPGDYATILFKGVCQPFKALEFSSLKRGHLLSSQRHRHLRRIIFQSKL